jgi:hypothetical protein
MVKLDKIISGGQTGVDQAALWVGLELGIEIGGWCPPGRICENGRIPASFPLIETQYERSPDALDIPRSQRTTNNVRDADGTLILKPQGLDNDKGIELTIACAQKFNRKFMVIDPFAPDAEMHISKWLAHSALKILNVAGPSESTYPGIGNQTCHLLKKVLPS